ncbi:MAG: DUF4270 domain-containing protein [Polaribacter sp.]|nr:DUF4270 domain-containing protein [Polaribacter sp.]
MRADGISRLLNQYLLGVYNSSNFEKLEASIISQIAINPNFVLVQDTYGADTTVVSTIDTVYLKLPYQISVTSATDYELDSVFGDATKSFKVNVFRSNTFLNRFNPLEPSRLNNYNSDFAFQKTGTALNTTANYPINPSKNDTTAIVKRRLSNGTIYQTDSVSYRASANSQIKIPTAKIPLNENVIKQLFLDKIGSTEFSNQDIFNDYFRGLIIEASGDDHRIVSLNLNNLNTVLNPSIEIFYTNTVLKGGNTVVDTLPRLLSMPLTGIKVNNYKMNERTYALTNEVRLQGAAGSEAKITLFTPAKLAELRTKNWLVNDAELTLYINQAIDTSFAPFRLYLYKSDETTNPARKSQILDATTEITLGGIRGQLVRDASGRKEKIYF